MSITWILDVCMVWEMCWEYCSCGISGGMVIDMKKHCKLWESACDVGLCCTLVLSSLKCF